MCQLHCTQKKVNRQYVRVLAFEFRFLFPFESGEQSSRFTFAGKRLFCWLKFFATLAPFGVLILGAMVLPAR